MPRFPTSSTPSTAAPLLCAGITTFNALRNAGARPGDVVAILGIGGLGHLARAVRARGWASTPSPSRAARTRRSSRSKLGAHRYIDSETEDAAAALTALGGAKVILATVTSGKAMTPLIDGLGIDGTLLVVGASPEPIEVTPVPAHLGSGGASGAGRPARRPIPRIRSASAR